MYIYFISYSHPQGFGRCELIRENPITSIDDIQVIEKLLLEKNNVKSLAILNYSLLKDEQNYRKQVNSQYSIVVLQNEIDKIDALLKHKDVETAETRKMLEEHRLEIQSAIYQLLGTPK